MSELVTDVLISTILSYNIVVYSDDVTPMDHWASRLKLERGRFYLMIIPR